MCHVIYEKKWERLFNWRVLVGLAVFLIAISPMLYAYYLQFDLHPEKVIRGRAERSGILFIFWEQSFERLSGEGVGKNSSDYFFFFHSFLWVFLPWTIIGLLAYGTKVRELWKIKFRRQPGLEVLTVGGITLIFILISFAQFKLPHYLNITIPLFAVLTASYLYQLISDKDSRLLRFISGSQIFIAGLVIAASLLICLWVFRLEGFAAYILLITGLLGLIFAILKKEEIGYRIITISALSSILINAVMNLHFYPSLLEYQGGSSMSRIVQQENIAADHIYKLSGQHSWGMDFYNREPVKIISINELEQHPAIWLYATDNELDKLREKGYDWDRQFSVDQFRITRLQAKFLNPETRPQVINQMHLIHLY